jgi:hypothetical protein
MIIKIYLIDTVSIDDVASWHTYVRHGSLELGAYSQMLDPRGWRYNEAETRLHVRGTQHEFSLAYVSKETMGLVASAANGLVGEWKRDGIQIYPKELKDLYYDWHGPPRVRQMTVNEWLPTSWAARRLRTLARFSYMWLAEIEERVKARKSKWWNQKEDQLEKGEYPIEQFCFP